jgi:hypothetical protein
MFHSISTDFLVWGEFRENAKQSLTDLYLELGTPTRQTFAVRVGHDDIWHSVEDAIKEKKKHELDDIAADCERCVTVTAVLAT